MVVLNLRDDCVARAATNFRRGMTDKRFLELEITACWAPKSENGSWPVRPTMTGTRM